MWCRVSSGHVPIRNDSRPAAQLHGVVGDEPVAADDQVERALALADAALPDDQHAEPEDVHQHAVDDAARGQIRVEHRGEPRHRFRRGRAGAQQRHAGAIGFGQGFRRRRRARR